MSQETDRKKIDTPSPADIRGMVNPDHTPTMFDRFINTRAKKVGAAATILTLTAALGFGGAKLAESAGNNNSPIQGEPTAEAPLVPGQNPEDLSPAEVNKAILDSYTLSEQELTISHIEDSIRSLLTEHGSTPQIIENSGQYIEQANDDITDEDVSQYSQLADNIAVYANILQANRNASEWDFMRIQNAAARHILQDVYFADEPGEASGDKSDDVVIKTLTEYVKYLPADAVIADVETLLIRTQAPGTDNGSWYNITVQYSDGRLRTHEIRLSNSSPNIAESINDPYIPYDSTKPLDSPAQMAFTYNNNDSYIVNNIAEQDAMYEERGE